MDAVRQSWKAVVAFFAPGLLLLAERVLLADGVVDEALLTRAAIVGGATSVVVWATRNGASPNPTTSTPGPGYVGDRGEGYVGLLIVGAILLLLFLVVLGRV